MMRLILVLTLLAGCQANRDWRTVGGNDWQVGEQFIPDESGEASMLVSTARFDDFRLSVEFWADADVNSGVFFRCQNARDITPYTCFEANIYDHHPVQAYRTGAVVEVFSPPLRRVETVGRWSTMEIVADGDAIVVIVNDETTARFWDDRFSGGHIALQWGGVGAVMFRNLKIVPIEAE